MSSPLQWQCAAPGSDWRLHHWTSSHHVETLSGVAWHGLPAGTAGSPQWPSFYLVMPEGVTMHNLGTIVLQCQRSEEDSLRTHIPH